MKINEPITPEQHAEAGRKYQLLVTKQKKYYKELAVRIESGAQRHRSQIEADQLVDILAVSRGYQKSQRSPSPDTLLLRGRRLLDTYYRPT